MTNQAFIQTVETTKDISEAIIPKCFTTVVTTGFNSTMKGNAHLSMLIGMGVRNTYLELKKRACSTFENFAHMGANTGDSDAVDMFCEKIINLESRVSNLRNISKKEKQTQQRQPLMSQAYPSQQAGYIEMTNGLPQGTATQRETFYKEQMMQTPSQQPLYPNGHQPREFINTLQNMYAPAVTSSFVLFSDIHIVEALLEQMAAKRQVKLIDTQYQDIDLYAHKQMITSIITAKYRNNTAVMQFVHPIMRFMDLFEIKYPDEYIIGVSDNGGFGSIDIVASGN